MPDDDCETRARGHSGGGWARDERTTGEADAWREGVAAAVTELRAMAARIRRDTSPHSDKWAWTQAATLEQAADSLAEMELRA